jgi:hypothetical protein
MKALLSLAAAALALAPAAGMAKPLWIPVSADERCHANANAISRETVFLHVQMSCKTNSGSVASVVSVDCTTWHYFLRVEGKDAYTNSQLIHKDSVIESVAYLACEIVPPENRLN